MSNFYYSDYECHKVCRGFDNIKSYAKMLNTSDVTWEFNELEWDGGDTFYAYFDNNIIGNTGKIHNLKVSLTIHPKTHEYTYKTISRSDNYCKTDTEKKSEN